MRKSIALGPKQANRKKYLLKKWRLVLALAALAAVLSACAPKEEGMVLSDIPVASQSSMEVPILQPAHDINFAELQSQNSDVIAWVRVPGTLIDYPVMRGIDNVYYLTHDLAKETYVGGSIFIDMINSNDFTDPVTVSYGHFMPDESLYTQLHNFKDTDFFENNKDVFIYLPDQTLQYEVVGAFNIGEENILYNKDFSKEPERQAFVDWLSSPRDMQANLRVENVTKDDRYFVMSTCQSVQDNTSRFIVVARLVKG